MINQHKLKTVRIQKINLLQSKIKILQILSQNSKTKYNNKSKINEKMVDVWRYNNHIFTTNHLYDQYLPTNLEQNSINQGKFIENFNKKGPQYN